MTYPTEIKSAPRMTRPAQLRSLAWQTVVEFRLFVRDPGAAFFALLFPLAILVANNSLMDDDKAPGAAVPMLIAMVLGMIGVVMVPSVLGEYRQHGVLRRLKATPSSPVTLLLAVALSQVLVALASTSLLIVAGMALYDLQAPGSPWLFALVWLLGMLSLSAVGFLVAALAPTAKSANAVGFLLYFPMLVASGAMVPREALATGIARVGDLTPLGPVVRTLRETWSGGTPEPPIILAMVAVLLAASALAAKVFRW